MFISRYAIFATPTLLFLDARGRLLADPLVGYNDTVNYGAALTGRLDEAHLALEAKKGNSGPAYARSEH